ncbi:hypothetical protein P3T36_001727 [Kitasatospora sp. MAP12-15]|uniref:effector-associated constant component EACC1 n=1 Tax=unclassified Kitasatospora TaxID=2633591 RepID=UPI002473E7F9|nr:hypothetical protein [Kitasatospora sp. MAP12-44]MDH6113394.1 hypothetical protein [Kitasatospora sp. MAP12-44]
MTQLVIAFDGAPDQVDADARDLQEFLNQDADLRGRVANRTVAPGPGEQGAVADAVHCAADLGALVTGPLGIWLTARLHRGKVSFRVRRADGSEIELSAEGTRDSAVLIGQLERFLDPQEPDQAEQG